MKAHTAAIEQIGPRIEPLGEEDELRCDRVPGMPLVGFFTGSVFSLGIWILLGWVAWQFIG
jgi:hypothetical protein